MPARDVHLLEVDQDELDSICRDAYRTVAPPTIRKLLEREARE